MYDSPLVSVVIPCYNSERFLDRAITSVAEQTYSNWEIIVVDDGSTDGSVELVQSPKFRQFENRIELIKLGVNSGAHKARNVGILKARGEFLAFLDADDWWEPQKLEHQLLFMQKQKISFSYTSCFVKSGDKVLQFKVPEKACRSDLLKSNYIVTSSVMIDIASVGKHTMPEIKKGQDLAFWLVILRETEVAHGLQACLSTYVRRSGSLSSNKLKSAYWVWKLYRDFEKLSFVSASAFFLQYALSGVKKYIYYR